MARCAVFLCKLIVTVLLALWLACPILAQSPDGDVSINHAQAVALDNGQVKVSAFVSVVNGEGQPYTRLTAADFSVFENNTSIESSALSVSLSTTPMTVTLLIDTSSGMAQPDPNGVRAIDTAKDAAIAFTNALRDNDQVAVYGYDNQARRQQDFTFDHNLAIDQGVVKLDATDAKAACLYDALLSIAQERLAAAQGQQAIIIVSGSPNGPIGEPCSSATVDDVLQATSIGGSPISIFTVAFGKTINQEELIRLSDRSGGRSFLAPDSTTLPDLLALLSEQLKNQYEISYLTQSPGGPAQLTMTENSSQNSDRRQVLIPTAIEPTPTPLPQFAIDLSVNQKLDQGKLEIQVNVPAEVTLTKSQLFLNNQLNQDKVEPPFDRFELNLSEVGSGAHKLRVEATDKNGVTASAEVELTLTLLPTPTPAPTSTPLPPAATPTPAATSLLEGVPVIALGLILAGLVLLILLIGLVVYFLFASAKRPAAAAPVPAPPPPPSAKAVVTAAPTFDVTQVDEPSPLFQPAAPDPRELQARRARLVVIDGQQVVGQQMFGLQKLETKIGRNTPQEQVNDIPILDKEVSRAHAKISYRDHQFFIQDLKSATGTKVNGTKLTPFQDTVLSNGAEVMIGPRAKFKFEFFVPRSINQTLDDAFSQDEDNDPDRTLYDY